MKSLIVSAFVVLVGFGVVALRALPARAQDIPVGPLVEISRPNPVAGCNDGFNVFGTWPIDEAEETVVAVNPLHPNNIVAAWIQGPLQDIVTAVSLDGAQTWQQVPIPLTVCSGGSNGTIGVSYYDFRFNDPNPGLPTDRWLVQCQPPSANAATNTTCWGNEVRLTNSSFNMEAVVPIVFGPIVLGDLFLGDYFGLAATSHGFVATFTQVDSQNITSIFARRIGP